jgi:hypothetical protein
MVLPIGEWEVRGAVSVSMPLVISSGLGFDRIPSVFMRAPRAANRPKAVARLELPMGRGRLFENTDTTSVAERVWARQK